MVTPALFIFVTMIGACSCASASSPNVVPLLVYGLSDVSVPPYFVEVALELFDVDERRDVHHAELALLLLDVAARVLGLLAHELLADDLGRVHGRRLRVAQAPPVRSLCQRLRRGGRVAVHEDLRLGDLGVEHVESAA